MLYLPNHFSVENVQNIEIWRYDQIIYLKPSYKYSSLRKFILQKIDKEFLTSVPTPHIIITELQTE